MQKEENTEMPASAMIQREKEIKLARISLIIVAGNTIDINVSFFEEVFSFFNVSVHCLSQYQVGPEFV